MTLVLRRTSHCPVDGRSSMAGHPSLTTSPSVSPSSQGDRELIDDLFRVYLEHVNSQQSQQNGKASVGSGGASGGHALGACRGQQQQPTGGCSPLVDELRRAVIGLTDEYQLTYNRQLEELRANWAINGESPRDSFKQVLDNIFIDGCNWGRFITIFVFASMFLRQCQQQRWQAAAVSQADVRQWSVEYTVSEVLPWIKQNGDWMGLIRFYKDGEVNGGAGREEGQMLKRLLTVAGAGLALMGLTSFLVNRA